MISNLGSVRIRAHTWYPTDSWISMQFLTIHRWMDGCTRFEYADVCLSRRLSVCRSVRLTAGQRAFWVRSGYEVNWLLLHLRNAFFRCILTNDFNDHKTENGKMHKNNEYRNKNECINCTFDWRIPFIYIIVIKIDGYNELIAHILYIVCTLYNNWNI